MFYRTVVENGWHGFVVAIMSIENIGKGLICDGTGFVTFLVKYQCVVFRPFKGEILEAVVTTVNKMEFFTEAGPVQIFVSNHSKCLISFYASWLVWCSLSNATLAILF
ncbi:hypothetical protein UlMin_004693 [Ulmus minor]